ncbi:histidine phosphatase family protein [Alkalihalobacillus deserti]|uniref:histidine phosphatase family protein n=1 Tax=Alkalihalobacillus deserti TaxID=2879466 RepID=UPI001D137C90|nr:histidine phosphatase family protein [Alkalihalobacillus deserti]
MNHHNIGIAQNLSQQAATINRTLLALLQAGGLILYARHAEANVGEDQPFLNFHNCLSQRNLSEVGRSQAVTYGEVLSRLRIPVMYPVLASPFCRTRETAALAFGVDYVHIDPFLVELYKLSVNMSAEKQERILNDLQSDLEILPPPGYNKVIIAHSLPRGVGFGQIPDMGTVVVKPRGQGNGYEVVTQVSLAEMTSLLELMPGTSQF